MDKGSSFAYVVPASDNYLPGLKALLNSLEYWNNKADVILVSFRLPDEFLNGLDKYSFAVRVVKTEGESQVEQTAIERFRVAYEMGKDYEAVCVLDADMFVTGSMDMFFEIAKAGFIVTGSNGMVISFDDDFQKKYHLKLKREDYIYPKVHTTVPIFLGKRDLDWFERLYKAKRVDSWDDFLYLNIIGMDMNKDKRMICLPPYTFTGIHHWQMKPATAVFKRGDILLSGTEEQVFMVHGKWWEKGWTQDLWPTMKKYLKDECIGAKGECRVKDAINVLQNEFNKYVGM